MYGVAKLVVMFWCVHHTFQSVHLWKWQPRSSNWSDVHVGSGPQTVGGVRTCLKRSRNNPLPDPYTCTLPLFPKCINPVEELYVPSYM